MIKRLLIVIIPIFLLSSPVWGETPGPISMEECIEIGIKNNFDLKKTNYDLLVAQEGTEQIMAQYEPLLSFSTGIKDVRNPVTTATYGSKSRTDSASVGINKKTALTGGTFGATWQNSKTDTNASSASFNPSYNSDLSLAYSQPLLNNFGGKNDRRNIRISRLKEETASLATTTEKNILINRLKKGYLDLNFTKLNLEVENKALSRSQQLLSLNKKKFADGLIEEVDIIALEAAVTLNEASIMLAKDEVKNAREQLLNIMGVKEDIGYTFTELNLLQIPEAVPPNQDETIRITLANRAELKIIKNILEIDSITKEIKANENKPSLNFNTSYGFSSAEESLSNSYDTVGDGTYPSWYVGLNLTLYPFSQKGASQVRASEYTYGKNMAEYERVKLALITDSKAIARHIRTQLSYIEATKNVASLQDKKFRLEQEKFAQGRSGTKWLLEYQDDLSQAEINNLKALTDYYKIKADFELITGVTE
ncbi:MAG: TolC family protein [Nitrospinota bacterium]|nr:TolC family protein [Nitrospinota bacterium]